MVRKVILILLAVLFLLFAYWQFNDPDPHIWVPIYGATGLVIALKALAKLPSIITLLCTIGLFVGFASYIPGIIEWFNEGMPSITGEMKATSPYIENMREGLGLLLAALAMLYTHNRGR